MWLQVVHENIYKSVKVLSGCLVLCNINLLDYSPNWFVVKMMVIRAGALISLLDDEDKPIKFVCRYLGPPVQTRS